MRWVGVKLMIACFAAGAACTDGRPAEHRRSAARSREAQHESRGETGGSGDTAAAMPIGPSTKLAVPGNSEDCPQVFEPSLAPVEIPKIRPNNSARRIQHLRDQIERVDVVDIRSYRVLFSLDDATLDSLRRTPNEPPIDWDPNSRPASLPAWPVALLFYITNDPLPFLGHFFSDGQVYFVDETDPWDPAVSEDGMEFRQVYSVPTGPELDDFLKGHLGDHDPFGQLAAKAQRDEDLRCGRHSSDRVSQP